MIYEVTFVGEDDGLCATAPSASYFVDSEQEAKMHVALYQEAGFESWYREFPDDWLEPSCKHKYIECPIVKVGSA